MLQEFAGTAFDPELVDLFMARLKTASAAVVGLSTPPRDAAGRAAVALRDIAGAHREEQTLYEIAQALGSSLGVADAMALIQEKVSRIVPFTTCALFLGDDEQGFVCRYAHGPGTEALFKWTPKSWSELCAAAAGLRRRPRPARRGARGAAAVPLDFEGRLIGGLVIYHTVAGNFSDEHRRVLGRVSEQAAAVIYNSTRFEQTSTSRTPIRSPGWRIVARSIVSSRRAWPAPFAAARTAASSSSTSID